MRKSHRTRSSQQHEFKRISQRVNDTVETNLESLSKKQRGLRKIEYEKDKQREQMTERQQQLNNYAKTLIAKGEHIKSQTRKWKQKQANFAKTFIAEERRLSKQLHEAELSEEPLEAKLLSLNRARLQVESRVDALNRQTISLAERSDSWQARIDELLRQDMQKVIFDTHKQLQQIKRKMQKLTDKQQEIHLRMNRFAQTLEKIHQKSNSVNCQLCVFNVEKRTVTEQREKEIHQLQYQVELAASHLAAAKRKEGRRKHKRNDVLARIDDLEMRITNLREQEADTFVKIEREKTRAMIAQGQISETEDETFSISQAVENVKNEAATTRDKGIDVTVKLLQLRAEVAKAAKQRRKVQMEIDKAKQEVDTKRRQLAKDESDMIVFMQVMQEIEAQNAQTDELENQCEKTIEPITFDTSKEEELVRATAERIEHEIQDEQFELEQLNKEILEAEQNVQAQRQRQLEIEDDTNKMWNSVTGGERSSKSVEAEIREKEEQRKNAIVTIEESIHNLQGRQENLRKTLAKRREILAAKHQKYQNETGGLSLEQQVGFLSLQDFQQLLSEEIPKWSGEVLDQRRPMLNSWGSKIDRLFEQLDSFYLTWL